jgi:hypothetical protein
VTTLDGLPEETRRRWSEALVASGGSQCGFCTPGIVMRLAALDPDPMSGPGGPAPEAPVPGGPVPTETIDRALLAHLCRCTGWQTIVEAARSVFVAPDRGDPPPEQRDLDRASARAGIEGGVPQRVGPAVVLGDAGFADDDGPAAAQVAVPDGRGGYVVAESLRDARTRAGRVQGRSSGLPLRHPLDLPRGDWDLTLRTTWVEPGYVETDASWCRPGQLPASPCGNGGAFGGKVDSPVAEDARRLADDSGRPVRVLWSREDVVRMGPKRPPVAGGIDRSGAGTLRVGIPPDGVDGAQWEAVTAAVATVAPDLDLEPVPLPGPPIGFSLRGAVWAEAAVLVAGARAFDALGPGAHRDVGIEVVGPAGGRAVARCLPDDTIELVVEAGEVLDAVVLRSYCIGAAHQALGWVRSEGIAVDDHGTAQDLTMRSFGILQARATPRIVVTIEPAPSRPAVNGSDAAFCAVAAARWLADGLVGSWPTGRAARGRS